MATITGSSSIDWSTIPFDPVNFESDIGMFRSRMSDAFIQFANGNFSINQANPFFISVNLFGFSAGTFNLSGANFDTNPIITHVDYFISGGPTLRMNCV